MKIQDLAYRVVESSLPKLEGAEIAEIGSGSGRLAERLARAGARVTALDLTAPETPLAGVEAFLAHDLGTGELPFESERFDCVVATEVIEHLRAPFLVLSAMVRVLRPGGLLVLTMPNYWNLKYRVRYLLTGNVQRPFLHDERRRERYRHGFAPHINVMNQPTLRTILAWEGCDDFEFRCDGRFGPGATLLYAPWLALIAATRLVSTAKRRRKYRLDETNAPGLLLGGPHVLVACRRRSAGT